MSFHVEGSQIYEKHGFFGKKQTMNSFRFNVHV
jgi:hypothetical protein